jgi:hypothetical protein
MKKCVVVALVALFAIGFVLKPSTSHAVEAKVGLTMMGDWWKPAFLKFENQSTSNIMGSNLDDDLDGSFMFGPHFWVNVASGWNLGGQMLFGLSRNEFEYTSLAIDGDILRWITTGALLAGYMDINGKLKARRYDLDLYAEHPVHKFLDVLIGFRFNYDDGNYGNAWRLGTYWFDWKKSDDFSAWYMGPSAGVQFHYEFVRGLVLSTAVSLAMQWGNYDTTKKYLRTWLFLIPYDYSVGYFCMGLDMNVKLAYYIAPAHLEVFVGGRYQFLGHIEAGDDSPVWDITYQKGWIGDEIEHWGGIFFGAAYKI